MNTKTRLILCGLYLPISCLSILWLIPAFVGLPVFMKKIEITNKSANTLYVTPFGQWEWKEGIGVLPVYAIPFPSIPSIVIKDFEIRPNETKSIWFDADDTWFRGLLVTGDKLKYDVLAMDNVRTRKMIVSENSTLLSPSKELMQLLDKTYNYRVAALYLMIASGYFNIFYFVRLMRRRFKERDLINWIKHFT